MLWVLWAIVKTSAFHFILIISHSFLIWGCLEWFRSSQKIWRPTWFHDKDPFCPPPQYEAYPSLKLTTKSFPYGLACLSLIKDTYFHTSKASGHRHDLQSWTCSAIALTFSPHADYFNRFLACFHPNPGFKANPLINSIFCYAYLQPHCGSPIIHKIKTFPF